MKKKCVIFLLLLLAINGFSQNLFVDNLQCEHKNNPLGINTTAPQFSWQLQSPQRNVVQTGYRILVADKQELLQKNIGNIWDSKKINSNQSIQVLFKGKKINAAAK